MKKEKALRNNFTEKNGVGALRHLEKAATYFVTGLFFVIVFFFTLSSFLSTAYVNAIEHTFFSYDNPYIHIFSFLGITIGAILIYRLCNGKLFRKIEKKINFKVNYKAVIYISVTIFAVVLVFSSQLRPRADQATVLGIASDMRNKNFSAFEKGGYIYMYPHQRGIVFLYYLLSFTFGDYNFVTAQMLNVAAFIGSAFFLGKITERILGGKQVAKITETIFLLFIPLLCYITFVYGNLIGLAFSLLSIWLELKYLDSGKSQFMLMSALAISVATIIKLNYIITFVAVIIYLVIDAVLNKRLLKSSVLAMAAIVIYIAVNLILNVSLFCITGQEKSDGMPIEAWISMGLQNGSRGEGWYNGYVADLFTESGYDTAKTREIASEDISASLQSFRNGEVDPLIFFARKNASQWNNPTFQCVYIMSKRKSATHSLSNLCEYMYGEKCSWIFGFYNVFQSLTLMGVMLWLIMDYKKIKLLTLFPAVVLIGGFLYHTICEAKGQYTITYFILLFPYAAAGYSRFLMSVNRTYNSIIKSYSYKVVYRGPKVNYKKIICLLAVFLVIITVSVMNSKYMNKCIKISGDENSISEYVSSIQPLKTQNQG